MHTVDKDFQSEVWGEFGFTKKVLKTSNILNNCFRIIIIECYINVVYYNVRLYNLTFGTCFIFHISWLIFKL